MRHRRIPRNFHQDLLKTTLSPDIFQVFALSVISGYRMADWLRLFGLPIEQIPRLQLSLPAKRTALLASIPFPGNADEEWTFDFRRPVESIYPLGRLLHANQIRLSTRVRQPQAENYLYARVGLQDAFAFPDLLPGSILRIDSRQPQRFLPLRNGETSRAFFLMEHTRGLVCCRLRRADSRRVTLHTSQLAFAEVSLELDREAQVRGVVDLEIRDLTYSKSPEVPRVLEKFWKPGSFESFERSRSLGRWIRAARLRSDLHFREASAQTAFIAEVLRDPRYFIASGSLSDYETSDTPPRHIQKILSLCAIYSLEFPTFLENVGLPLAKSGRDALPEFLSPSPPIVPTSPSLQALVGHLEGLPHFLAGSLPEVLGLANPAVRDIFWLDGKRVSFHPYLPGALLVAVDRRRKRPQPLFHVAIANQPLYLLLKRDGSYLCGRCSLEGSNLIVHPFSNGLVEAARFRNRVDAEMKIRSRRNVSFSWAQAEQITSRIRNLDGLGDTRREQYSTLILLAAASGLRSSELLALRINDVDFEASTIRVDESSDQRNNGTIGSCKNAAAYRTVLLHDPEGKESMRELKRLLMGRLNAETLVFRSQRGGPLLETTILNQGLYPALKALDLPQGGLHGFRRGCNRRWELAGINPAVIRQQMGHSSYRMTALYSGEIPLDQVRAAFSSKLLEKMENGVAA